jgi:hypothetical protein
MSATLITSECRCGIPRPKLRQGDVHICEDCKRLVLCPTCIRYYGQMMPPHTASVRCESGRRHHCTCSVCF